MSEDIKNICKQIVDHADPVGVILYGAKYTPSGKDLKEASFCVIVMENEKEAEMKMYRSLDTELPFNLLVYSEKVWTGLKNDPTSYAHSIISKGVLLYGKA